MAVLNKPALASGTISFADTNAVATEQAMLLIFDGSGGVKKTYKTNNIGGAVGEFTASVGVGYSLTLTQYEIDNVLDATTNYRIDSIRTEDDKRYITRLNGSITPAEAVTPTPDNVTERNIYKVTNLPVYSEFSTGDIVVHEDKAYLVAGSGYTGFGSGNDKPIQLHKANGDVIGYDNDVDGSGVHNLVNAAVAASYGDLIKVKKAAYTDIEDYIKLKNGVDWEFEPGCFVGGDSIEGTFSDDGVAVVCSLRGFPTIENSNGLDKRIVLTGTGSKVKEFWWELSARVYLFAGVVNYYEYSNTIGIITPSWSGGDEQAAILTCVGAFTNLKTFMNVSNVAIVDSDTASERVDYIRPSQGPDSIRLQAFTQESGAFSLQTAVDAYLNVKVFA